MFITDKLITMEFKTITDQLNSAFEDYLGAPQANKFPVQDELHQGNYCEPGFKTIRCHDGKVFKKGSSEAWSEVNGFFTYDSQLRGAENCITSAIREVFRSRGNYYLFEFGEVKAESFEDIIIDESTLFYLEKPKDQSGRRFWTVGLCNCNKWKNIEKIPSYIDPEVAPCKNFERDLTRFKKQCRKFRISWIAKEKNTKSAEAAKSGKLPNTIETRSAHYLWYAFEHSPNIRENFERLETNFTLMQRMTEEYFFKTAYKEFCKTEQPYSTSPSDSEEVTGDAEWKPNSSKKSSKRHGKKRGGESSDQSKDSPLCKRPQI
eukprot:GHVP01038541.1.p1 GENE.GHVP01038541.1~~GHVP01038541.1.p1  ORF type:complete len:319 (+),score=39.31 GHVP01038541.1:210-1166(+)